MMTAPARRPRRRSGHGAESPTLARLAAAREQLDAEIVERRRREDEQLTLHGSAGKRTFAPEASLTSPERISADQDGLSSSCPCDGSCRWRENRCAWKSALMAECAARHCDDNSSHRVWVRVVST